jgi:hypothetical protein
MLLSELYGRIGQILAEHGDMDVVRPVSLQMDNICTNGPFYKGLSSDCFCFEDSTIIIKDREATVKEKRFIINII